MFNYNFVFTRQSGGCLATHFESLLDYTRDKVKQDYKFGTPFPPTSYTKQANEIETVFTIANEVCNRPPFSTRITNRRLWSALGSRHQKGEFPSCFSDITDDDGHAVTIQVEKICQIVFDFAKSLKAYDKDSSSVDMDALRKAAGNAEAVTGLLNSEWSEIVDSQRRREQPSLKNDYLKEPFDPAEGFPQFFKSLSAIQYCCFAIAFFGPKTATQYQKPILPVRQNTLQTGKDCAR